MSNRTNDLSFPNWETLQSDAFASVGVPSKLEGLSASLEAIGKQTRTGSRDLTMKEAILTHAVLRNVRSALQQAERMEASRHAACRSLASVLETLDASNLAGESPLFESEFESESEENQPAFTNEAPSAHLRTWFLCHLASPFPGQHDKTHLRSLLPDCTTAHINGWMANMRRRSGWTRGVDEFGSGSKVRWQEIVRRVEAVDERTSRAEREYVRSIKDYVGGKRRASSHGTKVGDWLKKVIPGLSVNDEHRSTETGKVTKRRRTAHETASITETDRYEARSSFAPDEVSHMDSEEVEVDIKPRLSPLAPAPLLLPLSVPPHLRPLPSVPSFTQSRHLPLPAPLASPTGRTVSTSSTGTTLSTISDGQVFYHQQPQPIMYMPPMPGCQFIGQPMQSSAPMGFIASPPPAQGHLFAPQGLFAFTGVEGGSYVPFNPYLPAIMGHDGRSRQDEEHGQEDHGYGNERGIKRNYGQDDEEMGGAWKRSRG